MSENSLLFQLRISKEEYWKTEKEKVSTENELKIYEI